MDRFKRLIISDIKEAFTVCAPKGRHLEIINRKYYGLSFCKSGKITYTHNGKGFVSEPDCAIILPKGQTYELYNNEGGDFPLINFYCENNFFTDEFFTVPIHTIEDYIGDFEAIKALMLNPEKRLKAISLLYEIFDRLSRENDSANGILSDIMRYIEENAYKTDITNTEIAKYANISEVYLRTLFKEKYFTTPKQYILKLKIRLSKQLLAESRNSVNNIATACGFSNVYHFCCTFKKQTGITPTEYRRLHTNGI